MKQIPSSLFLVVIVLLSVGFKNKDEFGDKKKWIGLFNGKNLDGWTMKIAGFPLGENFGNTFRVENGILSVRYDQYKTFDGRFGALYYKKNFKNYRIKVEYRFVGELTPGAPTWGLRDSGVQYHCQAPGSVGLNQNFPVCLEYNLHGGNGTDDRPVGEICANGMYVEVDGKRNESYCTPAAVKRTFHGDQWVTLEIDARHGKIAHFVNGEEILKFENPKFDPKHDIGKTFINGTDDVVGEGYISLQSNSHPIDFRKIEILEYQ
jgi:hypothetical protein